MLEGVAVSQVEYYKCSHCPVVVCFRDCPESLLACGVPNLAANVILVNFYGFGGELDSDGGFLVE